MVKHWCLFPVTISNETTDQGIILQKQLRNVTNWRDHANQAILRICLHFYLLLENKLLLFVFQYIQRTWERCRIFLPRARLFKTAGKPKCKSKIESRVRFLFGGGGVFPYMGYKGMCGPKGYGFSAVLVINRISILADFGQFGHK